MKGISLKSKGVEYTELEDIVLKNEEWIKVKIKAAGLCGSDIQKIDSASESLRSLKTTILGHEFSGVIEEVGNKVRDLNIGDRITGTPIIPCYSCEMCKNGKYELCCDLNSIGKTISGAFAEYILAPSENIRKISNNLSFEEAALTDIVAVGIHSYFLADSPINKNILIFGDGAIGLTCLQLYQKYGNTISVIGRHHKNLVQSLGANFINLNRTNLLKDNYYDIIIEAVGRRQQETMKEAIRLVKPGGKVIVIGVFESGYEGNLPFRELFYKEASLVGSNSYSTFHGRNEFDIALEIVENKEVNLSKLITHILPLSEFEKGLNLMKNKGKSGCIKVVYKLENER